MNNPLLHHFDTPFNTAPFHLIQPEHYLPAMKAAIVQGKAEIDAIVENTATPTFENTVVTLELAGHQVTVISEIFFNLNEAETNEAIQEAAQEISPLLTEYSNDIMLNKGLFERVKQVWENRVSFELNQEAEMLLEKTYKSFTRNGALLGEAQQNRLREIDARMAKLTLNFGENLLAETNAFELTVDNSEDLKGLPEGVIEAAAETAKAKGKEGKWVFTLHFPSYIPFVTYAENRALREQMVKAYGTRAFKGDEKDNSECVIEIANLRLERAQLLGYNSHAAFVLQERMAETPEQVKEFAKNILNAAKNAGHRDVAHVADFAKTTDGLDQLQRWDFGYYSEKLKKAKYAFDDELLKPYFKLENVINGVFEVASKLYDLSFVERNDIPKYHPEVLTYEVKDKSGKHLSVFYADFFPREGKRNGAWMTAFRGQRVVNGVDERPHISIVCNFTKPTSSKPSLLTFNEVTTLFHEFGHALHGMLAKGTYASLSGTNVYWDFVELPSQILENWCYEKECLDLFATHYETGEKIPVELIEKLKSSATFMEGYATVRQIGLGNLDMAWHSIASPIKENVQLIEQLALKETDLLQSIEGSCTTCSFSHIFNGGYSSGYYSYKWAEVLDADAFEFFKEKGIFNKTVATAFKENILEKGGTEHPMLLYKRFRGNEPDPKALLRRAGLLNQNYDNQPG